jgi:antibiotic biosynthesis monooxygenase (ABM) superfamily enzyme
MQSAEGAASPSGTSFIVEHSLPASGKDAFLALQRRLQDAARKLPGYRSSVLELVGSENDALLHYRSTLAFDSTDALLAWIDSDARRQLLQEGREQFDYNYALRSSVSGFEGWFPSSRGGETAPSWKVNLLVLVTLYPTVLVLDHLLHPLVIHLDFSTAMLLGNICSVAVTGWILMPLVNRLYAPWLKPRCGGRVELLGMISALGTLAAVWAISR